MVIINATKTITKNTIASHLHNQTGLPKQTLLNIVGDIFGGIKSMLLRSGKAQLTGFGAFSVKQKAARPGFDMRSGTKMVIAERTVIKFTPSRGFKDKLNQK